jgi:hypothetical protein
MTYRLSGNLFQSLLIGLTLVLNIDNIVAQGNMADLEGTITDPSGGVVSGAKVKLENSNVGLVREIISKQGTNQWRGSLFGYLRNGKVSATKAFAGEHQILGTRELRLGRRWKDPRSDTGGLLQERDIRHLNLNAGLVVLSACDTSAGRLQGQEGMVNLVRAFFYAGARTVVASLWEAGDTATSVLMKHFYSHLMDGEDKAESLRHAKLDLLRKYGEESVPFDWTGFVTVGEGNLPLFLGTRETSLRNKQ